jgi:OmcA/MtrC family decaheme c-type cytochrome
MSYVHRGFLVVLAAVTLSFAPSLISDGFAQGRARAVRGAVPSTITAETPSTPLTPTTPTAANFTANQMEFYLSDDTIAYVRPGLKIKVNSITIPADRKPVVDITVTDNFNNPLDRLGMSTPGAVSISFILAKWEHEKGYFTSYTTRTQTVPAGYPNAGASAVQASADSGGTWTALELGHYTYKFRTALPADYPTGQTHTLGIYAARNLTAEIGKTYYANIEHDFRPDGQAVTQKWDRINQETSCHNCHTEGLAFHGGSRRNVKLCAMCHNPQTVDPDTGESQDMDVIIHKIHRGANLPSVQAGKPYIIVGHNQSVHDYSHIVYPQDIRNCQNCHVGTVPSKAPSQAHVFMTEPTRQACGSCHDNINWVTGEGHAAGPQLNDDRCGNCHQPDGPEFGASVLGAHTIPTKSEQLLGLNAKIVSVSNVKPGEKPTIVFKITNNDGSAVDGTKLATFAPILAGPTTDYVKYFREDARSRAIFDAAAGTTTYTFTNAIPADMGGTWAFSADIYRNATITRADGEADITQRESAFNPIHYAAATGKLHPRRTVSTTDTCNSCHDTLALHGGQRMNLDECVICHNPVTTDEARRPAAAGAAESVSMAYMIHRIHSGHFLSRDFTVYGFGGTPHNYNHVGYPTGLTDCAACHVGNSHQLPPPVGTVPTVAPREFFSPMGPGTAACLGCHDTRDAAAHAFLNTAFFPGTTAPAESCAACHGPGSDNSVDRVHSK